jgi:Tfp pilus assembly protein PilN
VKRDLNLIPRADTKSSANKYILPILLILVLYAATAYLAITIPQQRLQTKEDEYSVLLQEVLALQDVEVEYQALRAQLAETEAKKQTIAETAASEKDASNILMLIEEACPEDVLITAAYLTESGITLAGTASSDSLIAEFMVNLRAIELFSYTSISQVTSIESSFADSQEAAAEGTDIPETRQFELALAYTAAITGAGD